MYPATSRSIHIQRSGNIQSMEDILLLVGKRNAPLYRLKIAFTGWLGRNRDLTLIFLAIKTAPAAGLPNKRRSPGGGFSQANFSEPRGIIL